MHPVDARRRWFGALFLVLAFGLTIWGQTLLKDYLYTRPLLFVLYWIGVFGLLLLTMVTALLDIFATRRRSRQEQKKLFETVFSDDDKGPSDKSGPLT